MIFKFHFLYYFEFDGRKMLLNEQILSPYIQKGYLQLDKLLSNKNKIEKLNKSLLTHIFLQLSLDMPKANVAKYFTFKSYNDK